MTIQTSSVVTYIHKAITQHKEESTMMTLPYLIISVEVEDLDQATDVSSELTYCGIWNDFKMQTYTRALFKLEW